MSAATNSKGRHFKFNKPAFGVYIQAGHASQFPLYVKDGRSFFEPKRRTAIAGATDDVGVDINSDNFFKGTFEGQRGWMVRITGDRLAANPYSGAAGMDEAGLRISVTNRAANSAVLNWRGLNCAAVTRDSGVLGLVEGASVTADTRSGSTSADAVGLRAHADVGGTTTASVYAIVAQVRRQAATDPTEEGGILIRNLAAGNTSDTAIRVKGEDATNAGFSRLIDAIGTLTLASPGSNKVTLIAFSDSDGVTRYLQVDNAGTVSAGTTEG